MVSDHAKDTADLIEFMAKAGRVGINANAP